jgi:Polysaccharide lyase
LPQTKRARATRVVSTCGLVAACCVAPFVASGDDSSISSGLPADVVAITLLPGAGSFGPWQPVVQRRQASARIVRTASDGAVLQLADRRDASGFVVLRAGLASRSRATARADLTIARQRLAPGDARAFIEVGAANGVAYQAGAVRTPRGLRWGLWLRRIDGTRTTMKITSRRITPGDWQRVQLSTNWLSARSTATLEIDGRSVATTDPLNLPSVGPNRVNIGLGRTTKINELGAIFVRAALAYSGAGAAAVPATAPPAGGGGTVIPVVGGPGGGTAGSPVPSGVDEIPGREIARADYENADPSRYGAQRVAPDRIRAVTAPFPVAEGKYSGRYEVREGDNPVCCGSRAEILVQTSEDEGDDRWYTWATLFDDSFPTNGGWQVVTQWHSGIDGVPPMGFYAENGTYYLRTSSDTSGNGIKRLWETKFQKNVWYRIKLHVKWSSNSSVGFVEMWVNGQLVTPKTFTRNMYSGSGNYFKQGYYRQFGIGGTGVVYHDGFRATQVN